MEKHLTRHLHICKYRLLIQECYYYAAKASLAMTCSIYTESNKIFFGTQHHYQRCNVSSVYHVKAIQKKTQGKYRDVRCTKRQIIEIKLLLFFSILSDRRILLAAAMPVTMINDCSNILLKRIYSLVMHDGLRLYPHIYDALK